LSPLKRRVATTYVTASDLFYEEANKVLTV
jgi:hypothetical protein